MPRPQSPQYVQYWGSLRPCLVTTSGAPATRPVPPNPPGGVARTPSRERQRRERDRRIVDYERQWGRKPPEYQRY